MGMPRDMAQRKTLARVDDQNRQSRVVAARKAIYEKKYSVNSAAVNKLLRKDSLVPTSVRINGEQKWMNTDNYFLERIFEQTISVWLLSFPYARSGLDA